MNWRQTNNPYDTESDEPMTREDAHNEELAEAREDAHAAIGDLCEATERYIVAMRKLAPAPDDNPWHRDAVRALRDGILAAISASHGDGSLKAYAFEVFE